LPNISPRVVRRGCGPAQAERKTPTTAPPFLTTTDGREPPHCSQTRPRRTSTLLSSLPMIASTVKSPAPSARWTAPDRLCSFVFAVEKLGSWAGPRVAGGVTAMRDFQEIQYLSWWAALIVFAVGILIPVLILAAIPCFVRHGFSIPCSPQGWSPRQKLTATILLSVTAAILVLVPGWIFLSFGIMTTDVTSSELRVRFGWLPGYTESIPTSEIQSAQAIRYNPMDYGGWGIRARSENDRVLSQRGDQAVRLQLVGGQQLLIGSQQPQALATAIEQLRPPAKAPP
jgi:hypothetical protein